MVTSYARIGSFGALILAGLLLFAAQPVQSQTRSLSWTERTTVEVPGALGLIMRAARATEVESRMSMHVQGGVLLQGDEETVAVIDLDRGHYLLVSHPERAYTRLTFDELLALSQEAREAVMSTPGDPELEQARDDLREAAREAQATLTVRISSETTGRRQALQGGISGTQHFFTTEFEASAVPEGVDEPEGGSIIMVTELWQSGDVPSTEAIVSAWAQQLASGPRRQIVEEMHASAAESQELIAGALASWNQEIGTGLLKLAEEVGALEGTTIQSVTVVAMAPRGVSHDRTELLAWRPGSVGSQLTGAAAGAARQAAADAARGALRGLARGGLGRGGAEPEPEAQAAAPAVAPLFRVNTTKQDVQYQESSRDVVGELYSRIEGYQVRTVEDLRQ
jgi:hypothetical protein